MPKGLVILILLLLVGGYFLLSGGGGGGSADAPYLHYEVSFLKTPGGEGVISVTGYIEVKETGNVEVNGIKVELTRGGAVVDTKEIPGSKVVGPTQVPFSASFNAVEGEVEVRVEGTVKGSKEYKVGGSQKVYIPDPWESVAPPSISFSLKEVNFAKDGARVYVRVGVYNPNQIPVSVKSPKITVKIGEWSGEETLSISKVDAGKEVSQEVFFKVPYDKYKTSGSFTVSLKYGAYGKEGEEKVEGEMGLPPVTLKGPVIGGNAKVRGIYGGKLLVDVYVDVENPDPVDMTLEKVELEIRRGSVLQTFELGKNVAVKGGEKKTISKRVELEKAVMWEEAEGRVKVKYKEGGVEGEREYGFPFFPLKPQDVLDGVKIGMFFERESNTTVNPILWVKNGTDFTVEVKDISFTFKDANSDVKETGIDEPADFNVSAGGEVWKDMGDIGTGTFKDLLVEAVLSLEYGVPELNVYVPYETKTVFEFNYT